MSQKRIAPLILLVSVTVFLHMVQGSEAISLLRMLDMINKSPELEKHFEAAILGNPLIRKELMGIFRNSLPALDRIGKLVSVSMANPLGLAHENVFTQNGILGGNGRFGRGPLGAGPLGGGLLGGGPLAAPLTVPALGDLLTG